MKKRWDRSAMRFASSAYLSRPAMIAVTFENGDRFVIAVNTLLSKKRNGVVIDWTKMRIGETGDVLEAPAARDSIIEIPWDRIRAIADPEYRAHLTTIAAGRARGIGKRLRSLRLESSLTRKELADKIRVTPNAIADLEGGKLGPSIDLLDRLASALGKDLRDFASVDPTQA